MDADNRQRTLADVRKAIAENDGLRLDPAAGTEERLALEQTALALRTIERELLEDTSEALLDRLEAASAPIKDLAREVREKVTEMNAPSKILEHFKGLLSLVVRVLTEAGRW
ncbi:MAG TPA: hypothetical protein IAC05_06760 [Candidatus Coprenecus stercorigallinarum]|nr:hypothetical protein [Candidatus Coprenecus stercorigallinarum]